MKRGDLITVVVSGEHGKPRPAVIVQADRLESAATILVCLLTSEIDRVSESRIAIDPNPANGLRKPSLIQVEKIYPMTKAKCGPRIGSLSSDQIRELDIVLTFVLGLGD